MYTRFTTLSITTVLFISAFVLFPCVSFAQTVSLESAQKIYKPGDHFQIEATIDTLGKSINTVSGKIRIPTDFIVTDVRSGSTIISLWVTNPKVDASNVISFV